MKGFRSFILRGNVVDLAVGIVIGAAFTAVVNGFVGAFLTPLVGLATGVTGDMSRKSFTLGGTQFPYGAFVNAAISFLLLMRRPVLPCRPADQQAARAPRPAPRRPGTQTGLPRMPQPGPRPGPPVRLLHRPLPAVPAQAGRRPSAQGDRRPPIGPRRE